MATLQLLWIGDLETETRHSSELRPRRIEIGASQKETKFGRDNTKNPPDYKLESSINNRMVSRKHATIERNTQHKFMLYDHSLNGTYINYTRVSGGTQLKTGDIICFGHLNGANIKAGEQVQPYHSDLKYKVEVIEAKVTPDAKKKTTPKAVKRDSSLFDESSDSEQPKTKKMPPAAANKKTAAKAPPSGSNSSSSSSSALSSDDEMDTTANKTSRASLSKTAVRRSKPADENGAKKRDKSSAGGSSSAKRPPAADKKRTSGAKPSSGKQASKGADVGSRRGVGGAVMFHYENEECSAAPCKRPEDDQIDWIQCDKCSKWYHLMCVGLAPNALDDTDVYYCPKCKK